MEGLKWDKYEIWVNQENFLNQFSLAKFIEANAYLKLRVFDP